MRIVWVVGGGIGGAILGFIAGFGVALGVMSLLSPPRSDGTYGMREMLVCLPIGVILGTSAGVSWGLTTRLAGD